MRVCWQEKGIVFLMDLDVYAPSLQAYFEKEPVNGLMIFSGTMPKLMTFWLILRILSMIIMMLLRLKVKCMLASATQKGGNLTSLMVVGNKIIRKYSYFEDLTFARADNF